MNKKWTKTILITTLAVLIMAIGAIGVFAQTDDAPAADDTTGVAPFHGRGRGHMPHGEGGDRQAELADALGITVEELQAAQQEARAARISQLVEDGTLTLDQANLMLAMDALKQTIDPGALMAGVLGFSSLEEFEAAREDGSLRDLLADTTPAEMQEKMQAAFEDALQQAVAGKVVTAEQAELIREHMGDGFGFGAHRGFGGHAAPGGFGGHSGPGGFGGHGGPGGFGGPGRGNFSPPDDLQNTFGPSV